MEKRKKHLRPPFYILVFIIIVLIVNFNYKNQRITESEKFSVISDAVNISGEDKKISLAFIGDIMCHNTQYYDAYNASSNTYDFSYVFTDIKKYIASTDLAVGNLETTFAGSNVGYSSYPTFNTPEQLAGNLKDLGIDILTTANNHSLDKGYLGIEKTIEKLDEVGIIHTGTYKSQEESDRILIIEKNDLKIAILGYTYGTNGIPIPKGKEYCINLINDEKIISDLNKAKEKKPDLIICAMHWGEEYRKEPTKEQERLANLLFENGADLIIGNHPHVLEKMEKRQIELKDGIKKDVFIVYSLGNFMSGQVKEGTRRSAILNIEIRKDWKTKANTIESVTYTPIYMARNNKYKIMDIESQIQKYKNGNEVISSNMYQLLKDELNKVYNTLGDEIKN